MNISPLGNIGILYPAIALAAPLLVAGLVYIYLQRGRGKRVTVPTLLLLHALRRTNAARKNFVPPLRFFIELAVLLLLLAGAAGLYQKGEHEKVAIILDNSLSMGAVVNNGKSLFEEAASDLESVLASLNEQTDVFPYLTSPELALLSPGAVSPSTALTLYSSAAVTAARDNLEVAINRISASGKYDRIVVISERKFITQGDGASSFELRSPALSNTALSNLALGRAAITDSDDGSTTKTLSVTLYNFGRERAAATLTFEQYKPTEEKYVFVSQQKLSLAENSHTSVSLGKLPAGFLGGRVHCTVGQSERQVNALPNDDTVYVGPLNTQTKIAVVTDLSVTQMGLDHIKGFEFEKLTNYSSELTTNRRFLFHRAIPPQLPQGSSLFILPPVDVALFKSRLVNTEAQITRWDRSHPLMSYLSIPSLLLHQYQIIERPDWMTELMMVPQGATLLAGEKDGSRYAVIGFELFPYEGKSSPLLSIMLLNALKWLSDTSVETHSVKAYQRQEISESVIEARYLEAPQALARMSPEDTYVRLAAPGIVQLKKENGVTELVPVNFFSEEESNLADNQAKTLLVKKNSIVDQSVTKSFAAHIAGIVIILLLVDLLLHWNRKRELRSS